MNGEDTFPITLTFINDDINNILNFNFKSDTINKSCQFSSVTTGKDFKIYIQSDISSVNDKIIINSININSYVVYHIYK